MKIVAILLLALAILFAAGVLLRPPPGEVADMPHNLPWQIEPLKDGGIRVFGLVPGRDTLGTARDVLGPDMELAVVVKGDETGSLEMFYDRFNAGMLGGKLVLTGSLDDATLMRLREHSGAPRYLDSGARKYHLQPEDLPTGYAAPLAGITFIPLANIDEAVARQRFGEPEETLRVDEQTVHLLYPHLGLDLMINRGHREVLQYVAPRDFERLRAPLHAQQAPAQE